ncbi:MAG: hypothetical protein AAF729_08885 [Pseudomonadota bacterium]
MKTQIIWLLGITLVLGACEEVGTTNLPENVVAIAAPNQDLRSARLMPEDGCYWYRHNGPVETTMIPLRNVGGRPICIKTAS